MVRGRKNADPDVIATFKVPPGKRLLSVEMQDYIALRHQVVCSSLRNLVFSPRER
jgi:hypothetical protein